MWQEYAAQLYFLHKFSSDATWQGNRGLLRFLGCSVKFGSLLEVQDVEVMRKRYKQVLETQMIYMHTTDQK